MKTIRKNTTGYKEENLKDVYMLKPQALELVPTYDSDEDEYVLDLSNYHNHDILVRGGWNTLNKSTELNFGYCKGFNNIGKAIYFGYNGVNQLDDGDAYEVLCDTPSYFTIHSRYGYEHTDNMLIQCRNNDVKICPYSLL